MSDDIDITIRSRFDASGVKAAENAQKNIAKSAQQAGRAASQAAAQAGKSQQQQATAARQAEQAYTRLAASAARAATAQQQTAQAATRTAAAQANVARAVAQAEAAQTRAAASAMRLAQAQERANRPPGQGLSGYFSNLEGEIKGTALAMVGFGAALSAAGALAQSFKDAFVFKAQLDATNASIALQLKGIRDSAQVFAEADRYAAQYKLTQQETTTALQASVGILRVSNASVSDTLAVLQRLSVLNPQEGIEGAAFAVRELASGDILSLADRFNVSKVAAYEMRDAVVAGADVVTVLDQYLANAGVGMEALALQTEGAVGKMKDLALAEEALKLAQADFATSAGAMSALDVQVAATRGLAMVMNGEVLPSWDELLVKANVFNQAIAEVQASGAGGASTFLTYWIAGVKAVADESKLAAEAQKQLGDAESQVITLTQANVGTRAALAAALSNGRITVEEYGAALATLAEAEARQEAQLAANTAATDANTGAAQTGTGATDAATTAIGAQLSELDAQAQKSAESTAQTDALREAQQILAQMGAGVAGGLFTAGDAAAVLASMYGMAEEAALRLIDAQARVAAGEVRLAGQRNNTRDLTGGRGVGYTTPGRNNQSQDDMFRIMEQTQQSLTAETAKGEADRVAVSRKAAGIGVATQKAAGSAQKAATRDLAAERVKIEQDTANKIAAIDERLIAERIAAQRQLAGALQQAAADMVASQEANDLALVGASAEEQQSALPREQAEAQARVALADAVSEAQRRAAEGDVETANQVFEARQQQIQSQSQIDEAYYARQQELAGDPALLAALQTQYDEATAANATAAETRIAMAEMEAAAKIAAVETEKQAIIDAAAAQVSALGSTGSAAQTAVGNVQQLGSELASLPTEVSTTIRVNTVRTGSGGEASSSGATGGGSPTRAAGGGNFVTTGKTSLTVGDNPGGRELVTVTPLSGKGTTRVGAGMIALAGGGSVVVDNAADRARDILRGGSSPIMGASAPRPIVASGTRRAAEAAKEEEEAAKPALADYASAVKDNLDIIDGVLRLRTVLNDPATWSPISDTVLRQAAQDADRVGRMMGDIAATYDEEFLGHSKAYSEALSGGFSAIRDGLEVFDRLRGSEMVIQPALLDQFVRSSTQVAHAIGMAGAAAAQIPEASVTALRNVAGAASEQASALGTLAAFSGAGMGFGGGGGGSSVSVTFAPGSIVAAPGMDINALATLVAQKISAQVGTRR